MIFFLKRCGRQGRAGSPPVAGSWLPRRGGCAGPAARHGTVRYGSLAAGALPVGEGADRQSLFLEVTRKLPAAARGGGAAAAAPPCSRPAGTPSLSLGRRPCPPPRGAPHRRRAPAFPSAGRAANRLRLGRAPQRRPRPAVPPLATGVAPRGRASPRGREF